MLGELSSDDFVLAEILGMTVAELQATMGADEFHRWRAFLTYRAAMQDKAHKAAQAQAQAESRGRRR